MTTGTDSSRLTTPAEGAITLDPEATYTQPALAAALRVSERTVERWRKRKRGRLPRPFLLGRVPCWRGRTILAWMDNQQAEALA